MSSPTPVTNSRKTFYLVLIHLAGYKVLWPIIIGGGAVGLWLAAPYLIAAAIFVFKVILGIAAVIFVLAVLWCWLIDG